MYLKEYKVKQVTTDIAGGTCIPWPLRHWPSEKAHFIYAVIIFQ